MNQDLHLVIAYASIAGDPIRSTSTFISQPGEEAAMRKATYQESTGWYASITKPVHQQAVDLAL